LAGGAATETLFSLRRLLGDGDPKKMKVARRHERVRSFRQRELSAIR
jgi:hypothetical protein